MILLVIGDHASDDGTEAWPSQATIAAKASVSIRTVQRAVNDLVARGYLRVEKHQGGSADCREDRRPHRYTINMATLRGDNATGRRRDADGATSTPATGRLSQPKNLPEEPSMNLVFDQFWTAYPLKVGKQAALKAWIKAIDAGADPASIVEGARTYAADPNRHPSYTAHPSTWLNAGRWEDTALPPRELTEEEAERLESESRRLRYEQQKAEQEAWRRQVAEQEAKATPMPDYIKQALKRA